MAEGQRKIVLAVDGSEFASFAFNWYVKNVYKENDYLVCAHAPEIHDLSVNNPAVATVILSKAGEEVKVLEQKYIDKMKEANIDGKFCIAGGKPGEVICKVAEEEKATMIVTGTRGIGKLRRTIIGSVSDYVVHHAKMPVLVCRQ